MHTQKKMPFYGRLKKLSFCHLQFVIIVILKISHSSREKDNVIFDLKYLFWRFVQKGRISSMMCRQTGNREMSNRTGENGAEVTKGKKERRRYIAAHIFMS